MCNSWGKFFRSEGGKILVGSGGGHAAGFGWSTLGVDLDPSAARSLAGTGVKRRPSES